MVRNIAGVLIAIGKGEQPQEWTREVLEYRDRTLGGVTAPPQGLYLVGVGYPERYGLPVAADEEA
jgi:tRNA pseudouridine38-40 synthase